MPRGIIGTTQQIIGAHVEVIRDGDQSVDSRLAPAALVPAVHGCVHAERPIHVTLRFLACRTKLLDSFSKQIRIHKKSQRNSSKVLTDWLNPGII